MKHVLMVASHFLTEKRSTLFAGALLAVLTAFAGVALLAVSGWLITSTALAGLTVTTALAFDVFVPAATIRLLALTRTAARYGERVVSHDATLSVLAGMRERIFRGFSSLTHARSLTFWPARLLFRLTLDVDALDGIYLRLLIPIGVALLSALFALICLSPIDLTMGIVIASSLIIYGFGITFITARRAEKYARKRTAALEVLRGRVIGLVSGSVDLLLTRQLASSGAKVMEAEQYLAKADYRLNRLETLTGFGLSAIMPILGALMLPVIASLVEQGTISVPSAAFAFLLVLATAEPFTGLRRGAIDAGYVMVAARRIAPSLAAPKVESLRISPQGDATIVLDRVTARHAPNGQVIIKNLSLTVKRGEVVALVGSSGAGKSTLMRILAGEAIADTGNVETTPSALMTQEPELYKDTIAENLRLAKPLATYEEFFAALEAAGLAKTITSLPDGLDTCLGESGTGLSGGERRRLTLARLILKRPPLLLLDEPTEGLDSETANDIMHRLIAARGSSTIFMTTHHAQNASFADRIVVMQQGQFIAEFKKADPGFAVTLLQLRGNYTG